MAPKKQATPAFKRGREFKLILSPDVSKRIEAKAKAEGRPQSRIILNELSAFPDLQKQSRLGELVDHMETTLARYSARIVATDLGDALLQAIDSVLEAKTDGELTSRIDRLRHLRAAMLKHERVAKQ